MKRSNKLKRQIHKNRNWIFAGVEIGLGLTAVIFTVKGTLEYEKYRDDNEEPLPAATKSYWPAALCFGGFTALRIYDAVTTTKIQKHYSAALMALQGLTIGTVNQIQDNSHRETKPSNEPDSEGYKIFYNEDEIPFIAELSRYSTEYSIVDKEINLFYIPLFGTLFISNIYSVQNAEIKAQLQLNSNQDLYLNDLLDYLGLDKTGFGSDCYIKGDNYDFGDIEPFFFNMSPAMTTPTTYGKNPKLFYVIEFNRTWHTVYEKE